MTIQDLINKLPPTRAEVDWKTRFKIDLPTIGKDSTSSIFDKEHFDEWVADFKQKYGEEPSFELEGEKVKVTNPKFVQDKKEVSDTTAKAVNQFNKLPKNESMKVSEFKKQIREEILTNLSEKKKKTEEEVPEEETAEIELPNEEPSGEFGVDPKITTLQSALKAAYDAAKDMGDEKLTTQIGNTITYFTRTHVVSDKTQTAENLRNIVKESVKKVLKK